MNIDNPKSRKVSLDSTKSRIRFQLRFSYFRYFVFGLTYFSLWNKKNLLFRIELEIIRGALIRRNIREDEFLFTKKIFICYSCVTFVTVTFKIFDVRKTVLMIFSIVENNK